MQRLLILGSGDEIDVAEIEQALSTLVSYRMKPGGAYTDIL